MTDAQKIAKSITHEYREKILLQWLPTAVADLSNESMKLLWDAYFIYVDPNGIKKSDCPKCIHNVLTNWRYLQEALIEEEKSYNMFNTFC